MTWLLRNNWLWSLLAFLLGAAITWLLIDRRQPAVAGDAPTERGVENREELLVGAPVTRSHAARAADPTPAERRANSAPVAPRTDPAPAARRADPMPAPPSAPPAPVVPDADPAPAVPEAPGPAFSQLMDGVPTLFDDIGMEAPEVPVVIPPGRYGEGSADAVPHQGPPDGFTIKGNAQSMLFHTPDSPYYGRTKPQVWFRTESDAERAGFTKYTRLPRKSANPDS